MTPVKLFFSLIYPLIAAVSNGGYSFRVGAYSHEYAPKLKTKDNNALGKSGAFRTTLMEYSEI